MTTATARPGPAVIVAGELDTNDPRYMGLYIGQVVDHADSERLGRVRTRSVLRHEALMIATGASLHELGRT